MLIKIDPVTGKHINNAFGTGVDYIKIRTDLLATPLYDVDDISFDPVSGQLYAIANGTAASPSVGDRLVTINKSTGAVTDIARITKSTGGNLDDVEGLSFYGDGGLYATTGYHSATGDTNKLWYLDKDTGVATEASGPGHPDHLQRLRGRGLPGRLAEHGRHPQQRGGDRAHRQHRRPRVVRPGRRRRAGCRRAGPGGRRGLRHAHGSGAAVCDTTDAIGNYRIYGLTNGTSYNVTADAGHHPGRLCADHAHRR